MNSENSFAQGPLPIGFVRPAVLSGYYEWGGKKPASRSQAGTNHLQVLRDVADEAKRLLSAQCRAS